MPTPTTLPRTAPGVPEVRAVARAVALLRGFDPAKPFCGLSELAQAAGVDKGTARRLLQTLRLAGLVEQDPERGYALSFGLLELSALIHRGGDLQRRARPLLSDLAERFGALAFLWVYDRGEGVCLDRVCATNAIVTALITPGNRSPLNCGAAPRVVLAYASEEEREKALAGPQLRRTPASVTDPDALREIAQDIRAKGYEFVADDFIIGLAAVGAPIFDRDGGFVGALSVVDLSGRFEMRGGVPAILAPLKAAARKLALG